jgi:homotetrameric cytidine deaminase
VYTSADSVFQVAAHEDVVPLDELYAACEKARAQLVAPHDVSRVIARPFVGEAGAYRRTMNRRDYSLAPPGETLLDALAAAGVPRAGVGKVDDLFAGRSLRSRHTADNAEGIGAILEWLRGEQGGLLFANLVDFDTLYGHRNDPVGFARALREFDEALPSIRAALREDDLLFITADHGNDPTTGSSDHARENVPLLALGASARPVALGARATFADLGATVAEWLNVGFRVGAALLASDGSIVEGCNVENAAYPATICAERAAVAAAVTRGVRDFEAIVIATESETPASPCGMCRQVLMEFAPHLAVLSVTRSGAEARWSMSDLLPHAFTPTSLGRR